MNDFSFVKKRKTEREKDIIARCKNRESYASIARSYGISGARVYQIYYRYKIETGSLKV